MTRPPPKLPPFPSPPPSRPGLPPPQAFQTQHHEVGRLLTELRSLAHAIRSSQTIEPSHPVRRRLTVVHDRLEQMRSEEHTSELQSRLHLVCRLLLEKKKKKTLISTSYMLHATQTNSAHRW